jgi:hypothetical protein
MVRFSARNLNAEKRRGAEPAYSGCASPSVSSPVFRLFSSLEGLRPVSRLISS